MAEHIVKSFEGELEALSTGIAQMGGLAEAQLQASLEAVAHRDSALAEKTVAEDRRIDAMEQDIDLRAVRLLALRQPMAIDLREAVAAIKISTDLERIGDLAKNIAKRVLIIQHDYELPNRLVQGILRMGRIAQSQLKSVLDAYSSRDAQASLDVWRGDEELDAMYNSVFRELLTYMMEDPRMISACTHLLFIAKNLERTGDHATNVAEAAYYLITGERLMDDRPKGDNIVGQVVSS
ncbi:MAG: phosphate signaling complex protein PhoU [Parvibaculaceae bacterium]|nr:phosphate signaling complex protein PhoU [Parvibaculaceae bacterium]